MDDLIDTVALQSFLAVAEEFNFRRAAERLHIDQSALSRRIQRLEAQIGFELFSRTTRDVWLTNAGRVFYESNLHTLARLRETVAVARRAAEGKTGHLRIGYMSFAAIEAMPRAIHTFRSLCPDIGMEISYFRTQGQKLALARGDIDVGFMIGPFVHEDFASLRVSNERLVALLPVNHPLAMRPQISLADLAECEVVLGDSREWEFYRSIIWDLFSTQGLTLRPAIEASSTLGILGLVAAGLGVSLYPESLRRLNPRHVVMKAISGCDQCIETILVWRRHGVDSALRRFIACCRDEFGAALEAK